MEEHLPFNLLQDWNLTAADLAPYKVLVLPNTACLAPNQMEAIRGFVEAGGGLVASMEVGGFDQTGNP
ncbi:MAG: beta-galactosidase trimerization domain-containing protein, partial [bacterium]